MQQANISQKQRQQRLKPQEPNAERRQRLLEEKQEKQRQAQESRAQSHQELLEEQQKQQDSLAASIASRAAASPSVTSSPTLLSATTPAPVAAAASSLEEEDDEDNDQSPPIPSIISSSASSQQPSVTSSPTLLSATTPAPVASAATLLSSPTLLPEAVSPSASSLPEAESSASSQQLEPSTLDAKGFMSSWIDGKCEWYNFDTIDTNNLIKLIDMFKYFTMNSLQSRPVNGAILSFDSELKNIKYFDYGDFKNPNGSVNGGANLFFTKKEVVKQNDLSNVLGLAKGSGGAKNVVSLLSEDKRIGTSELIGMCYSTCAGSDIDRKLYSNNAQTTRLICSKNQGSGKKVKIVFFNVPGNRLGYMFFTGDVNFDKNGKYTGLKDGTLLRKMSSSESNEVNQVYEVLKGKFEETMVTPQHSNEFFRYSNSDAKVLKLIGYVGGNIGWNFQYRLPVGNTSNNDSTFLNWNFGPITVKNYYIEEQQPFECNSMYYTSYRCEGFGAAAVDELFNAAAARSTTAEVVASQRKMEFIKKQNYIDKHTPADAKVTSHKFKCKVADGVFCIIEYNISADSRSDNNRVRVYKSYDTPTKINDSLVKKHGLFIGFGDGGDINFVSFFEVDENEFVTGITYKKDDTGRYKFHKDISPVNNKLVIKKQDQRKISSREVGVDSKCEVFDDFTKQSFDFSLLAAAASYKLFLDDTNGLTAKLVSDFELSPENDLGTVKRTLAYEFKTIKEQVQTVLKNAMGFVETVENSESYLTSVKKSSFRDVFQTQNAVVSETASVSVVSETAAAAAPASNINVKHQTITKKLGERGFNLLKEAGIDSDSKLFFNGFNTNIAGVDDAGDVTVHNVGTTNITVSDGNEQKQITLDVVAAPLSLEEGGIAMYQADKVFVEKFIRNNKAMILPKNLVEYPVYKIHLTPIMSKAEVAAKQKEGKSISQILADESTSSGLSSRSSAAPASAPVLGDGGIAMYNGIKVIVEKINHDIATIKYREDGLTFNVKIHLLTPIMSAVYVQNQISNGSKSISDLLKGVKGGKGRRRRSTRKYQKRRGRGNGNNGRRRLTRKVKGQSGGGGARRGGKIHRKTKKNVRRGRGGRRGHRRTIKKYHRR